MVAYISPKPMITYKPNQIRCNQIRSHWYADGRGTGRKGTGRKGTGRKGTGRKGTGSLISMSEKNNRNGNISKQIARKIASFKLL